MNFFADASHFDSLLIERIIDEEMFPVGQLKSVRF